MLLKNIQVIIKWWQTWHQLPILAWVRAAAHYRSGNYTKAQEYYERGLQRYATHPAAVYARLDLAFCYFKSGRLRDAEEQLRLSLFIRPAAREAYLRLARLLLWSGRGLESAWTMRRALRALPVDPELAGVFLLAVLESEAPRYLFREALRVARLAKDSEKTHTKLEVALALYELRYGDRGTGLGALAALSEKPQGDYDAVIAMAEIYFDTGDVTAARRELRRAMQLAPLHPKILALFAQSYLQESPLQNPEYAQQLATSACQYSEWQSPFAMHVLARSYYQLGDKMSALVIASKALEAGSRLLGTYRACGDLKRLVDALSTGTQA